MGDTVLDPQPQTNTTTREGGSWIAAVGQQARNEPLAAFFVFTIFATVIGVFFLIKLYAGESIMLWAWKHWLPNLNQEHGKLVIPISLALLWYHRKKLAAAPKAGSNWGLLILAAGFFVLLLGTRASQPRISLFALPLVLAGIVTFVWGKHVARILAFPIGFLVFMVPLGALQQTSFRLQYFITNAVQSLSALVGVKLFAVGTTLRPVTGDWGFEIAEGCSGIRSLIAIIMLTAIYAHIFEKDLWKKIVLVAFSIAFAVIANAGRIFTIILLADLGYPKLAGGIYHESSGFLSFPIALAAMYFFHKLLNLKVGRVSNLPLPANDS